MKNTFVHSIEYNLSSISGRISNFQLFTRLHFLRNLKIDGIGSVGLVNGEGNGTIAEGTHENFLRVGGSGKHDIDVSISFQPLGNLDDLLTRKLSGSKPLPAIYLVSLNGNQAASCIGCLDEQSGSAARGKVTSLQPQVKLCRSSKASGNVLGTNYAVREGIINQAILVADGQDKFSLQIRRQEVVQALLGNSNFCLLKRIFFLHGLVLVQAVGLLHKGRNVAFFFQGESQSIDCNLF